MHSRKMQKLKWLIPLFLFVIIMVVGGYAVYENKGSKAENDYQQGLKAVQLNRPEEAVIHFGNALKINPDHARAHFQLGLIYIEMGKLISGVKELKNASRKDPELLVVKNELIDLYLKHHVYERAIPLCREIISKTGGDNEIFHKLEKALIKTGNFDEAKSILDRLIEEDPGNTELIIDLAFVYFNTNRINDAIELMKSTSATEPDNMFFQLSLARFYEKIKGNSTAEKKLLNILQTFPNTPLAYTEIARFYLTNGHPSEAEQYLKMAIQRDFQDPNLYYMLAYVHHLEKRPKSALKRFQDAAELSGLSEKEAQKALGLLADYHIVLKQYNKAVSVYRKILDLWPNLIEVKLKIALLLMISEKFQTAEALVDELLTEYPYNSRLHLLRGLLWHKKGVYQKSRNAFSRAQDLDPEASEIHYYYGLTLLDRGYTVQALAEMHKSIESDPGSNMGRIGLAFIYFPLNKTASSLDLLNHVIDHESENRNIRRLRAAVYTRLGHYASAIDEYRYMLEKKLASSMDRFNLASLYQAENKTEQALADFHSLLETDFNPIACLEKIIQIHITQKNFHQAISICKDYLIQFKDNLRLKLLLARIYIHKRDYQQAKAFLSEVLARHPRSEQPYMLMADLYIQKQAYSNALTMYEIALEKKPNNIEALMKTARIFQYQMKFDHAIRTYEQVLQIDDTYVYAQNNLAFLYALQNQNLDRALILAQEATQSLPHSSRIMDTLGFVYFKKDSHIIAKKHIGKALKIAPDEPVFNYHMGLICYKEKDFRKALKFFEKSIALGLSGDDSENAFLLVKDINHLYSQLAAGQQLIKSRNYAQALDTYKNILSRYKLYGPAQKKLAFLYAESDQDIDRAMELAQHALKNMANDSELLDIIGWIYFKKGSFLLAKRHIKNAISISPDIALFHYHLGMVHYHDKDFELASVSFKKAVSLGLEPGYVLKTDELLKMIK